MLFGVKLANEVYPPWKQWYIDYDKLKKLLKESVLREAEFNVRYSEQKGDDWSWSDRDESDFVAALDEELEKVYGFQSRKYNELMERLDELEERVASDETLRALDFGQFRNELEEVLSETQELENFSRLNFTGFIKIVKKHDRLHGEYPSVKSLLQVRLKKLPFHSEEYSPLLYRISLLYDILRNNSTVLSKSLVNSSKLSSVTNEEEMSFQSFKFWIHPDNFMEVKTRILRHLPMLVYASMPSGDDDFDKYNKLDPLSLARDVSSTTASNSATEAEYHRSYLPVITTLFFDNENFDLYNNKLLKVSFSPTVRLRWIGKLVNKPDIFLEQRMFVENKHTGTTDFEEVRLKLKQKFISGLIFTGDSEFKERTLAALKERGSMPYELTKFGDDCDSFQKFIIENELQPVLRTMYTRTAFQIPGDDRIRITIDSDIFYIKEDSFDKEHPIRDPKSWHRPELDADVPNPLACLKPGESAKFPYCVMEIIVKNPIRTVPDDPGIMLNSVSFPTKHSKWIEELTNSHLVKEVPRFSKYIQGVASLFGEDDKFEMLPFWLPDLESDIRMNPGQAYEQEKRRLKQQSEVQARADKMRRFSVLSQLNGSSTFRARDLQSTNQLEARPGKSTDVSREPDLEDNESSDDDLPKNFRHTRKPKIKKDPNFFRILTGREAKLSGVDSEDEEIELPAGVKRPTSYIKNAGPLKIEAKVWLANERTFNKWLSITTTLSIFTFAIINSSQRALLPNLANTLSHLYFGLTLFTGIWAYMTYSRRISIIKQRSGQHLDAPLGLLILSLSIAVILCLNFVLAFKEVALLKHSKSPDGSLSTSRVDYLPPTLEPIERFIFKLVGVQ